MTTEQDESSPSASWRWQWHKRHPDRWKAELAALRATGWTYRITRTRQGQVRLLVNYPLPPSAAGSQVGSVSVADQSQRHQPSAAVDAGDEAPGRTVKILVRFPDMYPWFGADFIDSTNGLRLVRHRVPATGLICLLHDEHRHLEMTVAEIMSRQIPKLLRAGRPDVSTGPSGVDADGPALAEMLELPLAEPVQLLYESRDADITVPDWHIPEHADSGTLSAAFGINSTLNFGGGTIRHVSGPEFWLATDISEARLKAFFPLIVDGVWVRDPDFDPRLSAARTVARLRDRLVPAFAAAAAANTADGAVLHQTRLVGLLVPSEREFRGGSSEEWVFILCHGWDTEEPEHPVSRGGDGTPKRSPKPVRWYQYVKSRHIAADAAHVRTPVASRLTDKRVVVAGLGALGSVIAQDLGRTGVGHLTVLDKDKIDCTGSGARQPAPFPRAGTSKVLFAAEQLILARPQIGVRALRVDLTDLPLAPDKGGDVTVTLLRSMAQADLVVDATANPSVTRWLSHVSLSNGRPFLHVSATAGAWGGIAALLTPSTGCWACVEHWRADGPDTLRIPPADPAGWVNPPRCSETTFTGTAPDLLTVAGHAARIAIDYLANGNNLGGDYHVATMATADGKPVPVSWSVASVPVHPECRATLHHTPVSGR